MEWVETTGRTVEEAKDAALDRLGVDERDAEFDVLEEARSGLFGRVRQEARVRARVRPDHPRPRVDRRERRRQGGESTPASAGNRPRAASSGRPGGGSGADSADAVDVAPRDDADDMLPAPSSEEQAEEARAFLDGLAAAFGLQGVSEVEIVDGDQIEARLVGDGLGLLIGPKGQTLAAVQDLTRAVVQRGPRRGGRMRVDVGGYQQRRREALVRFARQTAEQVKDSGVAVSMEPMPAYDRKVVHDTINDLAGVQSRSEGEEPRRQVLIVPDVPAD